MLDRGVPVTNAHKVPSPASLSRSVPAVAASVPLLRNDVVSFAAGAGASAEQLGAIRLAVSEAVTNVVVHAYTDEPGSIHLTAALGPGELTLLVADDGCGVNRPARHPGLGWGLALIAQSGRGFTIIERADGGTEARITFPIGDGGVASSAGYERGSSASATAAASARFSTTT
jgi:anti-sigma regulatory factor (Ser/Thr protein kinase)